VPEAVDGGVALALLGEPVAEAARVERWVGELETRQASRGPRRPQAGRERERSEAQQARRAVRRARQAGAPGPGGAAAGRRDGERQAIVKPRAILDAEPAQEAAVGVAAAQEDVLPVVDLEALVSSRPGGAAQADARLEERDARAGVGAGDGRAEPG